MVENKVPSESVASTVEITTIAMMLVEPQKTHGLKANLGLADGTITPLESEDGVHDRPIEPLEQGAEPTASQEYTYPRDLV